MSIFQTFAHRCVLGVSAAALAMGISVVTGGTATAHSDANAAPSKCGQVMIGRGSWLGGNGVLVRSNGSSEGTGNDCSPQGSYVDGVLAGRRWQCAELVNRLYLTRGWTKAIWSGNAGKPMWDNAPGNLTKQVNGNVDYLGPGDVLDINVYYKGKFVSGHVFVVNATRHVISGSIGLVSQNNSGVAQKPGSISNGTVTVSGAGFGWTYHVIGVIHAP